MSSMDLNSIVYQGTALGNQTVAVPVQVISANGDVISSTVDTQGFEGLEFLFFTGALTDGTYTVELFDNSIDDFGTAVTVSPDFVLGDYLLSALTLSDTVNRIGYVGKSQYVWLVIHATGVTTGATVGAVCVQGFAHHNATPYPFGLTNCSSS